MRREVPIYVVRHGETEWSANGRHTSRTDLSLTERGRERARALGSELAERAFSLVLTSPAMWPGSAMTFASGTTASTKG